MPRKTLKDGRQSEYAIQLDICKALRLAGCTVLHTSVMNTKGGYGSAKGVPDLLVHVPGEKTLIGLEVKRPGGEVRPDQKALAEAGAYAIVRSVEDALFDVFERSKAARENAKFVNIFDQYWEKVNRG
jgi:hypothetical protein